ncbi:MAG: type IV secretion system DNA-binding domain-containing protein [Firmicutes bacterium]|nr:type IV secretion system DNA-binding domain-containing protein [Bacillota bacterium]
MNSNRLISDFISKYRKYITYAFIAWFVVTAFIVYIMLGNLSSSNVLMCFVYVKAKFRSLFFFLPDDWFMFVEKLNLKADFKKVIRAYHEHFDAISWKFYLYIFFIFVCSFTMCAFAVYKYFRYHIEKFNQNIVTTGHLLNLSEFQKKYHQAFGDYLKFSELNFSERVFWTPFYVWGSTESVHKTIGQFLSDARAKKRKIMIFEERDTLFKSLSEKDDILLNPQEENGVSWNFLEDLKVNKRALTTEIMDKINSWRKHEEIEDIIKHIANLDIDTEDFFKILCFAPFKQIKPILKSFTNVEDDEDIFIKIRNKMADDLYFFKMMTSKKEKTSIYEYYKSDKSVLWMSCGNDYQVKSTIPFIEKIIDPKIIKIVVGERLINFEANTIVVNHSPEKLHLCDESRLMLSGAGNSKRLIQLFGETTTEYPSFFGIKYAKEKRETIPDLAVDSNNFFRFCRSEDVLRF